MQAVNPVGGASQESARPRLLSIPEIQGIAHRSVFTGDRVATMGVVTAVERNGFWIQSPENDGDPLTSQALFVFTRDEPTVERRSAVVVEGRIGEWARGRDELSQTQISGDDIRVMTVARRAELPQAVELGKDRPIPRSSLYEAGLAYESLEGMRVRIPGARVLGPTNRFGDAYIAPDVEGAPALTSEGMLRGKPGQKYPQRLKLTFDPKVFGAESPALNAGDYVGPLEGIFFHDFGFYGIKPVGPVEIRRGGRTRDTTSLEGTDWGMTVASFNVENLDPKVEDSNAGSGRSDDDIGSGKLRRVAEQIAKNLKSPDVVSLQEIQDNNGSEGGSVTDASRTWRALIDAIMAAGGPRYEWIDSEPRAPDVDGGQPGGNIRVGFLYNPERVRLDRESLVRLGEDTSAFESSRKSLSAAFEFIPTGEKLHVVNNHWSSKFGSTPTYRNPNYPRIIGGEAKRKSQQEVIQKHIEALLGRDPGARVLSVGDFNAPEYEAPLRAHGSGVLFNLGETVPDADRYSYVFQGVAEAIDHQLGSRNLKGNAEMEFVHVNSPFVERASDHDPNISRIDMR